MLFVVKQNKQTKNAMKKTIKHSRPMLLFEQKKHQQENPRNDAPTGCGAWCSKSNWAISKEPLSACDSDEWDPSEGFQDFVWFKEY